MKNVLSILLILCIVIPARAQVLQGKVTNSKNEPIPGATVHWLKSGTSAITNQYGRFEIKPPNDTIKQLIASFVGYSNDTIKVSNHAAIHFSLSATSRLSGVTIKGQRPGQYVSSLNPAKTTVITAQELQKGACCDLAGCFNTTASVQAATTDVVTDAKELRMLGLSGVYNQVLLNGFPMIEGLSYTYGISNIPGPLINTIDISKGANSVVQGHSSISGQIDVETKEPDNANKLFLNLYLNSFQEKRFDAYYTSKKKRWSNTMAIHTTQAAARTDRNHDRFLDLPLITSYQLYDKLKYGKDKDFGWSSHIGIRYLNERRIGGQTSFNASSGKGSLNAYGQTVNINQPELMTKTAYRFNDDKRVVLSASGYYQKQNSWFGTTNYNANQKTANLSLRYEWDYHKESNLKAGISYRYFDLNEKIAFSKNPLHHTYDGDYRKQENIPGVFAENNWTFDNDKFTWIAGVRLDHHNQFGFFLTPRTLLKYSPAPKTSIRASVGTGWRTANVFSENVNILASQRDIIFKGKLNPERAINYGLNFIQDIGLNHISGSFSADYYITSFQNQIYPNYDADPTKIIIKNFTGPSVSNAFQAEINLTFYKRLSLLSAYNIFAVYRKTGGVKKQLPFIPRNTLLNTFSYKPINNKWHIDGSVHWTGIQQLPNTSGNPPEYQRPGKSKPYTTVNVQFTYNFKKLQVYAGCENIFDFRQKQPIISWQNPFGPYFDVSSVWGPTKGREGYIGLRFSLKK